MASKVLDMRKANPPKFKNGREKILTPKQIRARARRKAAKGKSVTEEVQLLYKPVEEWDAEELARGRPRDSAGGFTGRTPTWVNTQVREESINRFQQVIRGKVQMEAVKALEIVHNLLHDDEVDDKGKPLVPASVKLDAAKWLTEHIIGKPTQRVEQDISVKLQAVLAQAVWSPSEEAHPAFQGPVQKVIDSAPDTFEAAYDYDVDEEDDD
jgi:hypothetical protein